MSGVPPRAQARAQAGKDLPLTLRGPEAGGPWGRIRLEVSGPGSGEGAVDGWLLAGGGGAAGSVHPGPPAGGHPRWLAAPPAWPGSAPDEAPGAPRGDAAAFGQAREDVLLAACYAAGLAAAERAGVRRLGVASLGAATDRPFPADRAARVALGHAVGHFARRPAPEHPAEVVFFLSEEEAGVYRHLIQTRSRWAAGRRRA